MAEKINIVVKNLQELFELSKTNISEVKVTKENLITILSLDGKTETYLIKISDIEYQYVGISAKE